jgi:hypothetical protein
MKSRKLRKLREFSFWVVGKQGAILIAVRWSALPTETQ